jgi:hypothetical protein
MAINPALSDKDIPHRTTIQDRIIKKYKMDRIKLREKLKVCFSPRQRCH